MLNNGGGGNYIAEVNGTAFHALDKYKFTIDPAQCSSEAGWIPMGGNSSIISTSKLVQFAAPSLPPDSSKDSCSGNADREHHFRKSSPCCSGGGATCGSSGVSGGSRESRYYLCYSPYPCGDVGLSLPVMPGIEPDGEAAFVGNQTTSVSVVLRDSGKPYIFDDLNQQEDGLGSPLGGTVVRLFGNFSAPVGLPWS